MFLAPLRLACKGLREVLAARLSGADKVRRRVEGRVIFCGGCMVGFKGVNATVMLATSVFVCDGGKGNIMFANLLDGFLFLCVYVCTRALFAFADVLLGVYFECIISMWGVLASWKAIQWN